MKTLFLSLFLFAISLSLGHAQAITNASKANRKIQTSKVLSPRFKKTASVVLSAAKDCTPPKCSGIVDPWTCECYPDIKDPWEVKVLARKMEQFIMFETLIAKGEGKSLYPETLVTIARKKYPGKSLNAIVRRLNYYIQRSS
ncbi:MAG: hypothetical protein MRZ79_22110 [Bacteroidia bacterium]|nr:hypothetical protein [Bacteroidia bacterium]